MSAASSPVPESPKKNLLETTSNASGNNNESGTRSSKRRSTQYSSINAKELEQLSQFMGLSGSESDGAHGSESDDEYRSRAQVASVVKGSERRKTRSPSTSFTTSPPRSEKVSKKRKKKTDKFTVESRKERKLSSEKKDKNYNPDEVENDEVLAKFFAAENAAIGFSGNEVKAKKETEEVKTKKHKMTPGKKKKKAVMSPKMALKEEKTTQSRKRKSGTPRKLEVIEAAQMDTWESSVDTEIVKNSANDAEYRINERKFS